MMINIAIDGPSGAGKSTLAKMLAKKLGYIYVDTGALYRSIGLYMFDSGINPQDKDAVIEALSNIKIELRFENGTQKVYLNGTDVKDRIRLPEMSMYASLTSAIPEVRAFLLDIQKDMAKKNNVIMDGRDIGTVILPDAQVKIFLVASSETRAKRRYKELAEKGIETSYEEVLSDIIKRDENDSTRAVAPAVAAPDAVLLDSSDMNADEALDAALKIIEDKIR